MNKTDSRIQQVSIKGFLCRNEKVLLLKTPTGRWEMPGGRINFSETIEEAFQREMIEEIGFINVKMGKLVNSWSFTSIRNGVNHHFIVFDFEMITDESIIKLSNEHTEYQWIGKNEFEELNMREGHKETIRKFSKNK